MTLQLSLQMETKQRCLQFKCAYISVSLTAPRRYEDLHTVRNLLLNQLERTVIVMMAAYMKEQEDKEAWKTVTFFHPESDESKSMLENLISTSVR